jgi:hypothetical protein
MTNKRYCQQQGCDKRAVGKTFCVAHGGGKRCQQEGCGASAQGNTNYCKAHGGGKRCQQEGCGKSAQGKTNFCIAHGGGKRCQQEGCKLGAIGKTNFCIAHGGGKRCQQEGCGVSAIGKTNFCKAHGGGNRCQQEGCRLSAQGKTNFCVTHGGGKRCQQEGCKSSAQDKTNFCKAHGGGKRCPNCIDWIDSRCGDKKYNGYCATCFKQVFPNDKRSKTLRIKGPETKIRNLLAEHYPQFIHDKVMYTNHCDCTHRRRIDFRYLLHDTMICVEVDERQHKGYNTKDEEDRYHDLYMIYSGKWLFIRFNPDSYLDDKNQRQNPNIESRYHSLLNEIQRHMTRVEQQDNQELIEVHRLFFDFDRI